MGVAQFLNQAAYQDYPFRDGFSNTTYSAALLDRNWIVDAQLVYGVKSGVTAGAAPYLDSFTLASGVATFKLRTNSALSVGDDITWTFAVTLPVVFGQTMFATARLGYSGSTDPNLGTGFLQFGDLTTLGELADGVYSTASPAHALLEPARFQTLYQHYVRSLRAANKVTNEPVPPCSSLSAPSSGTPQGDCLTPDDLRYAYGSSLVQSAAYIYGGYHAVITLSTGNNSITITPSRDLNASQDLPCTVLHVSSSSSYTPVSAPSCADLLYTINGEAANIATGDFKLLGGQGVTVVPDPYVAHQILVTIDSGQTYHAAPPLYCPPGSSATNTAIPRVPVVAGWSTLAVLELHAAVHALPANAPLYFGVYPAGTYRLYYVTGATSCFNSGTRYYNSVAGDDTGSYRYQYLSGTSVAHTFTDHGNSTDYNTASALWAGTYVEFTHTGGQISMYLYDASIADNTGAVLFELRVHV